MSVDAAIEVYFPHAPWQRGTNENTNGLLRQYFPKGTDFSGVSEAALDAVAHELNDRPPKRLGFYKPNERSPTYCCVVRQNPPKPIRTLFSPAQRGSVRTRPRSLNSMSKLGASLGLGRTTDPGGEDG